MFYAWRWLVVVGHMCIDGGNFLFGGIGKMGGRWKLKRWIAEAVPQLTQSWIPTRTFLSIYNTKCQLLLLRITYAFAGRTNFFFGWRGTDVRGLMYDGRCDWWFRVQMGGCQRISLWIFLARKILLVESGFFLYLCGVKRMTKNR